MEFVLAAGLFGALIQLTAYVLNLYDRLSHESVWYSGTNAIGCVFTGYYAVVTNTIPFLLLELVWGGAALYKLTQIARVKKKTRRKSRGSRLGQ